MVKRGNGVVVGSEGESEKRGKKIKKFNRRRKT